MGEESVAFSLPYRFENGTIADADQVNENFKAVAEKQFIVVDAADGRIGQILIVYPGLGGALVYLEASDGRQFGINISTNSLQHGEVKFATTDCSGTPYLNLENPPGAQMLTEIYASAANEILAPLAGAEEMPPNLRV